MKSVYKGIILGYGNMGRTHHQAAQAHGAEITAVIDPDPAARRACKLPSYASVKELATTANVDFAVISTPTDLHASTLNETLTRFPSIRGILLEKPPVRTSAELEHLRTIKFPHIFVGEVEQYNPELKALLDLNYQPKSLAINRQVNLAFFLHGSKPWFLDVSRSGGIVLDLVIHDLNLLTGKFGLPLSIEHVRKQRQHYNIDDNVSLQLRYSDFTANLQGTWTSRDTQHPIRLDVAIEDNFGKINHLICTKYLDQLDSESNPYHIQMADFLESLKSNKLTHPLADYLDATELALEILDDNGIRT